MKSRRESELGATIGRAIFSPSRLGAKSETYWHCSIADQGCQLKAHVALPGGWTGAYILARGASAKPAQPFEEELDVQEI
jgi:hypothetical protein